MRLSRTLTIALVGVLAATVAAIPASAQQGNSRQFPLTGWTVEGDFLSYWETNGGLPVFGYPLSTAIEEDGTTVQYFERARFERHIDPVSGDPIVLLGLLGVESAEQRGLPGTAAFQPAEPIDSDVCRYFPETGHNLCFGFRTYWERFGGLAIYGYPISEEFVDPETGVTVQFFQRQRFEWHPGVDPTGGYDVLLGRLGAEYLQRHLKPADSETPAAGTCGELEGELVTITAHPGIPGPRCIMARPDQQLQVANDTDQTLHVALSYVIIELEPGQQWTIERPVGEFLAPGVHRVSFAPLYSAEIVVLGGK